MDELTDRKPLLLTKEGFDIYAKSRPILLSSVKCVLRVAIWLIFVAWAGFIFLMPSDFVRNLYLKWRIAMSGTLFGITGTLFVFFSAPVLLIALLAFVYLAISGEPEEEIHVRKKGSRIPRLGFRTFPVIVDGPFGVVSAAEMIGIIIVITYVIWSFCMQIVRDSRIVASYPFPPRERSISLLEQIGAHLGSMGLYCLAFLFLPVARGSVLLRYIDIPFEHATRYHIWLGHLTMSVFTLHGLFLVVGWTMDGRLIHEITEWKQVGVSHFPGVISLLSGLLMWVTSLPGVRRRNFELFFYTHQLYIVFVVFLALHVGDSLFCIPAGGIFLFLLDRVLRFFQSRRKVDVLSARCFPCGTVELVLSKSANLRYNALGWIFLQVRELSWLQWHPFSVSSSPLDGKDHLSILVKVLGGWTSKLERQIRNFSEKESQTVPLLQSHDSGLTVSVEGPYGHESPYHLTYEHLILVAGGIGISPFLAILSDILHRIGDGKPCLPRNILIIWATKTSSELQLLQTVDMDCLGPNLPHKLRLEIQTYVTRESEPSLEHGKEVQPGNVSIFPASTDRGISGLVGTGNIVWSGIYFMISTIGFITTVGLLDIAYINPYKIDIWWYKGLLFVVCMASSILIFGGLVIFLWHIWEKRTATKERENMVWERRTATKERENTVEEETETIQHNNPNVDKKPVQGQQFMKTIQYGRRPNFKAVFESMCDQWGSTDIGVVVCGPPALQKSIARECRSRNLRRPRGDEAVFHFHSHSFDL